MLTTLEHSAAATKTLVTHFTHPPIPVRQFDWCAHYDGEEESGNYGWGRTEADAIADFFDNCADGEPLHLLLAMQAAFEGAGYDDHSLCGRIAARQGKTKYDCDGYEPADPLCDQRGWVQAWVEGNEAEWDLINAEGRALNKGAA